MAFRACSALRRSPRNTLFIDLSSHNNQFRVSAHPTRCLHGPPKTNEYSDTPLYPPIPQYKDKKEKNTAKTKDFLARLGTVEEKQYFLNKPKYYGWYSYNISNDWIPSDAKPFLQFATQTHIVEGLPDYYKTSYGVNEILEKIAPNIESIILNHHLHTERAYEVLTDKVPMREPFGDPYLGRGHVLEAKRSQTLIKNIHQALMTTMMTSRDHLQKASEDMESRNESFWFRGGIQPDKRMLSKRLGTQKMQKKIRDRGWKYYTEDNLRRPMTDEELQEPYERALQYTGQNLIQLRAGQPLAPLVDRDSDPLVTSPGLVPRVTADPRVLGFKTRTRHGTNLPGVWPDVDNQHGLLFYTDRLNKWTHQSIASQGVIDDAAIREMTLSKALVTAWGWVSAQASHLGFSPLTELTYPLVTQGTVTDGQNWTFAAYQLNTLDLSNNDLEATDGLNNVMWVSEAEARLFSGVEDGQVKGFSPEVLLPLVKMYLNEPQMRNHSLTPYLSEAKTVANTKQPYLRNKMHENIRHMYSNRPRHMEKPEMYLWEKVNLVDHAGAISHRLGSRRKRWFQMYKVHHWGREHWHPEFMEYGEMTHPYQPKAYRSEDWMKKKGLGRRYSKYHPKLSIPLEDEALVYKLPKTNYEKDQF